MINKTLFALFITLFLRVVWPIRSQGVTTEDGSDIQNVLNSSKVKFWSLQNVGKLQRFYQKRNNRKAWTPELLSKLVTAINASTTHGHTPCDYRVERLQDKQLDELHRELMATDAYMILAGHLLNGKVNPVSIEPGWNVSGRETIPATEPGGEFYADSDRDPKNVSKFYGCM